jgi:S-formylglutathione hydrolase FrmB
MDEANRRGARRVRRRTVLASVGMAGVALTGVAVTTSAGKASLGEAMRSALGAAAPVPTTKPAVIKVERVYSASRGREVDLLTVLPPGVPTAGLPMSVLLHGLHGSARRALVGRMPDALASAVGRGAVSPFGFVAVDGGDNYWHENVPGDDPMAMLLEEVPRWLAERGLGGADGLPFAGTGVSMGGFGALVYARRRQERRQPVNAVAAISPGLMTSWQEMSKRHAFASPEAWAALDPLRHADALGAAPIGVWIGDRDRFVDGTRKFMRSTKLVVASVSPGGHDDNFYRTVVPDVVRFVGKRVPADANHRAQWSIGVSGG